MVGTEIVTLVAAGFEFSAWEHCHWTAAINEACRSFSVDTTERLGQYNFPQGTPVQLLATGTLVLDGYVNRYSSHGAAKAHNVNIGGRSKSQDWVDCSGVHPTGHAKNKSPVAFAQELDQYDVGINDELGLEPVEMQQLSQGETCFDCLERHLRPHGATQMGEADGSVSVTNASVAKRATGALVEGVNILEWSVDFGDQGRHQHYTIKGQNRHGHGAHNMRIKETAHDSGVRRNRHKIIVHETDTDQKRARNRAHHEKERCAGDGIRATVRVQGWRDDGGKLWTPNTIIFVGSPLLMHLEQDMLIEKVEGDQDSKSGTTTTLHLVDPRAYRGKGQNGKGSDANWNAGLDGE